MSGVAKWLGIHIGRFGVAIVVVISVMGSARSSHAQVTPKSLIGSSLPENAKGPYLQDLDEAIKRFYSRDFNGARSLLETAKKKEKKLPPPEVMMAQLAATINQPAIARGELERAIKLHPSDPEAYLILAEVAYREGRMTEASLLYTAGSTLANKFSENALRKVSFQKQAYAGLALVDEAKEKWESAATNLEKWIELESKKAEPQLRLGSVLLRGDADKNEKEAYDAFVRAVKIDSKVLPPDINMGSMYSQLAQSGDKDKAKEYKAKAQKYMEDAATKGTDNLPTQLTLITWYMSNNDLNAAEAAAEKALTLDPNSLEAKLGRGIVARLKSDYKTAKKWLESAHTQSPGNSAVTNHLALALLEQKSGDNDKDEADHQRALEFADTNLRLNQKSPEAAATFGWIAYKMNRQGQAITVLEQLTQSGNLSPESAYYLAYVLNDQGKEYLAFKLVDAALSDPRTFPYRARAEKLRDDLRTKGADAPPKDAPERKK